MLVDLNHGSDYVYGGMAANKSGNRVNALIDEALAARSRQQRPRGYLGGSRIGEPCARKLVYEIIHTPVDPDKAVVGQTMRVFDAGHQFEALTISWLRAAGFELRSHGADGEQFGFVTGNGRIRGHIDGVIVAGPDIGIVWPALFEHKAVNARSWTDIVKRGVQVARPVYYAQLQFYMAYMELEMALFTALNKDNQALYHEAVVLDVAAAQALSDKAVDIIRFADVGELPPRITGSPDYYLCSWCDYARRCWRRMA